MNCVTKEETMTVLLQKSYALAILLTPESIAHSFRKLPGQTA
jgi:hypothetical protein